MNTCLVLWFTGTLNAQVFNKGDFYVSSNVILSVYDDLINSTGSELVNNGDLYLFQNLTNDGSFGFDAGQNTSMLNFVGDITQAIDGVGITNVFDMEFNNSSGSFAFSLDKEVNIFGTLFFQEGIIHETTNGILSYKTNATYENLSTQSYVNNRVRKLGNSSFVFPVGDYQGTVFIPREARITTLGNINDQFSVAFNWANSDVSFSHAEKEASIGLINMNEFWEINREIGSSNASITLTWNSITTPDFISSNIDEMIIVRWNGVEWVNEGGVVNVNNNEITTTVSEYGVFTLANKSNENTPPDLDFSDSFSPDGDGINDVFVVPGLAEEYPNFKMKIYNRYGSVVYDYKNNGNLNPLWWNGKAKKSVVISGNNQTAPASTYWYIIYFNDGVTKPYQGWLYLNK